MYQIIYTKKAAEDIPKLKAAKLDKRAKALIEVIRGTPYQTPPPYEKLMGDLQGAYSRRINLKHRLVYEVQPQKTGRRPGHADEQNKWKHLEAVLPNS